MCVCVYMCMKASWVYVYVALSVEILKILQNKFSIF